MTFVIVLGQYYSYSLSPLHPSSLSAPPFYSLTLEVIVNPVLLQLVLCSLFFLSSSHPLSDSLSLSLTTYSLFLPLSLFLCLILFSHVLSVFILCWSPYFVWDLLQVYGFIPLTQQTIAISTFIQSLAPLNSAANPIIYGLFSRRTRNPSTYVTCSTCCTTTSTTSTSSTNTACCYK